MKKNSDEKQNQVNNSPLQNKNKIQNNNQNNNEHEENKDVQSEAEIEYNESEAEQSEYENEYNEIECEQSECEQSECEQSECEKEYNEMKEEEYKHKNKNESTKRKYKTKKSSKKLSKKVSKKLKKQKTDSHPSKVKLSPLLPPLPKFKKNDMNRLVSNMLVTSISKPNLQFYITFGTGSQEGISALQWFDLFSLTIKGIHAGRIKFIEFTKYWDYEYQNHIMCKYFTDGRESECCKQKIKSRLLFTNEHLASLQYTLLEHKKTYEEEEEEGKERENSQQPKEELVEKELMEIKYKKRKRKNYIRNPEDEIKRCSWVMKWIYLKESEKLRYEFIQTVIGKTKEDACNQEIRHILRIYPENISFDILNYSSMLLDDTKIKNNHHDDNQEENKSINDLSSLALTYNATMYTQQLIKKILKVYGQGPNPSLIHCPLRHKSKKPEPKSLHKKQSNVKPTM